MEKIEGYYCGDALRDLVSIVVGGSGVIGGHQALLFLFREIPQGTLESGMKVAASVGGVLAAEVGIIVLSSLIMSRPTLRALASDSFFWSTLYDFSSRGKGKDRNNE